MNSREGESRDEYMRIAEKGRVEIRERRKQIRERRKEIREKIRGEWSKR